MAGILPSRHLSGALCIPQLWLWLEKKLSLSFNAVSKYRVIAKDAVSILRELMYTCTPRRWLCRAKSLQCLVLSTYLWCQLILSPFLFLSLSLGLKCFPCLLCHGTCMYAFACLNVWACACVCGFIAISGNTVGKYQRNLQQCHVSLSFSDSLLCYLQVMCVQLQMAYICLNLRCLSSFPRLAQSFLLFLYKVFVFSQREWFTHHSWGGGKTEVPTCPVG